MNEQDKEAFEKWDKEHHFERCHGLARDAASRAWQAALEYRDKEMALLHSWVKHHQKSVENALKERNDERERSKKLVEALEKLKNEKRVACYMADGKKIGTAGEMIIEALKEYRGEK